MVAKALKPFYQTLSGDLQRVVYQVQDRGDDSSRTEIDIKLHLRWYTRPKISR
jgi:hypothetical protein